MRFLKALKELKSFRVTETQGKRKIPEDSEDDDKRSDNYDHPNEM